MKNNLKKILLLCLSFVLVAALAIGGTLAYLTSTDDDVNVMTLGNVQIEQIEQERNSAGELVEFTQAKPLYPAVGEIAWNDNKININGHDYNMFGEKLKNSVDKIVSVKNTGKSDAYIRTWIAVEDPYDTAMIGVNVGGVGYTQSAWTTEMIGGVQYSVTCFTYDEALQPDETSLPSLLQVYLNSKATNEDVALLGDAYDILVVSQAVQTNGFASAIDALEKAFGTNHPWTNGVKLPAVVSTAEELTAAIAEGGEIILSKDITDFNANNTISVAAGKNVTLNLNGHKISATANKTGNQELFLVKGNMTVKNGTLELTAENNQAWNAMATIFDVTAGGVLNMEGVIAKVDGTDMNFIVHLNNWGEATLNVNNCDFTASYVAVRVFNSGYDMNNVTIKNTDFHTGRVFWVHNYTAEGQDDSTLNLDIYGNNNTTDNQKPVRFGFSNSVYYDINGNALQ